MIRRLEACGSRLFGDQANSCFGVRPIQSSTARPGDDRTVGCGAARLSHTPLKSGLPSKATPEEAKAVIANSIAYFGKYALDETSMVLSLDIQASTFANQTGNPSEKRNVTSLTETELKFNRPFVKDVTLEAVFKRAE